MTISALELSYVVFCCIEGPLRPSPDDLGDVVGVVMVEKEVVGGVVVRGVVVRGGVARGGVVRGVGGRIGISLLA